MGQNKSPLIVIYLNQEKIMQKNHSKHDENKSEIKKKKKKELVLNINYRSGTNTIPRNI